MLFRSILGITCDNASNNDTMIENLATIMSHFSGEANRARCLAHIVNMVAKIILRQFEVSKNKKKKKIPKEVNNDNNDKIVDTEVDVDKVKVEKVIVDEEAEESDDFEDERDRVLDKEEKEMDRGGNDKDNEDSQKLLQDVDILEEQMRDEIDRVGMKVKPVRQALFKVNMTSFLYSFFLPIFSLTILSLTSFFYLPSFF